MYCEEKSRSLSGKKLFFWQIIIQQYVVVKVCFHVVEGNLPVSNNIMWTVVETALGAATGSDLD